MMTPGWQAPKGGRGRGVARPEIDHIGGAARAGMAHRAGAGDGRDAVAVASTSGVTRMRLFIAWGCRHCGSSARLRSTTETTLSHRPLTRM